jgi:predicted dehydrogenase
VCVPVNVAVLGCGYWGPNLIRNFLKLPRARLALCCDLNPATLEKVRRQYPGVETTTDPGQVLANPAIEAVAIATPARTHFEVARECLLAGKHVLVEKPLALNVSHAEELVCLARARGRVLMVGHTFEYNAAVRRLKRYIDEGDLGRVYYVYSTRVNLGQVRDDVNAMWNLGPHDFSILIYLLGAMPLRVSARGSSFLQAGIEDVVFADLEFPGGVMAHVHLSWLDPSKVRRMTVVGEEKMVVYDDVDNEAPLKLYDKAITRLVPPDGAFGEFHLRLRAGDILIPRLELREPLEAECADFVESIASGTPPQTDGENGLRVVKVLAAAQASLHAQGAWQAIE